MKNNEETLHNTFYTIILDKDNKFMNSNFMKDPCGLITEAIRFDFKEDAEDYIKNIRKERLPRIVKVKCEFEEVK